MTCELDGTGKHPDAESHSVTVEIWSGQANPQIFLQEAFGHRNVRKHW